MKIFGERALKSLNIQAADVLLLGWHNRRPPARLLDQALALKEHGKFRVLGLSGLNRKLFPELAQEGIFDVFHLRYNAAHRGAETEAFPALQELPPEVRPGLVTYTATRWGQLLKDKRMPPGEPAPTAADCYRFALSHPAVDVCMTGPKDLAQMHEGLRALDLGPLHETELARLRRLQLAAQRKSQGLFVAPCRCYLGSPCRHGEGLLAHSFRSHIHGGGHLEKRDPPASEFSS